MERHLEAFAGFLCGCGFVALVLGLDVTVPWTRIAPIWAVSPPWAVNPRGAWELFALLIGLIIALGEIVLAITVVTTLFSLLVLLVRRAREQEAHPSP